MIAKSIIFFCLITVIGFMMLSNATNISQNTIAVSSQETYRFVRSWGSDGSENGQFILPHSLATDKSGNIYVTDTGNNRVEKFSSDGTFISKWGSKGTGNGQFIQLHDINVSPDGKFVYIVELGNHRVQKFTSNGTFIKMWGTPGQEEQGKFSDSIPGIAVDKLDNIYVIDRLQSVIQKFDGNGTFITMWGSKGSTNGTMQKPEDLAINSMTGDVYVTDTKNSRIQEFNQVK
jgi:DNA-binding beta-propeller fold protein YncE